MRLIKNWFFRNDCGRWLSIFVWLNPETKLFWLWLFRQTKQRIVPTNTKVLVFIWKPVHWLLDRYVIQVHKLLCVSTILSFNNAPHRPFKRFKNVAETSRMILFMHLEGLLGFYERLVLNPIQDCGVIASTDETTFKSFVRQFNFSWLFHNFYFLLFMLVLIILWFLLFLLFLIILLLIFLFLIWLLLLLVSFVLLVLFVWFFFVIWLQSCFFRSEHFFDVAIFKSLSLLISQKASDAIDRKGFFWAELWWV